MKKQVIKTIKRINYPFLLITRLFLSSLPAVYFSHFVYQEYIAYLFRGVNEVIMSSQCENCFRILEFSVYRFLPLYSLLFLIPLIVKKHCRIVLLIHDSLLSLIVLCDLVFYDMLVDYVKRPPIENVQISFSSLLAFMPLNSTLLSSKY